MRELSITEINQVSAADRGDAAVAGALAGATYGRSVFTGASWGARLGAFAGPAGVVVGGGTGALIGAGIYYMFK